MSKPSRSDGTKFRTHPLPSSLFEPTHQRVAFLFHQHGHPPLVAYALPDTAAQASVIHSSIAYQLTSADNARQVNIRQVSKGSEQMANLTQPLSVIALFIGDNRKPIEFIHSFVIMDMDIDDDNHILIGSELIGLLFPDGVPVRYLCKPAHAFPRPTLTSTQLTAAVRNHKADMVIRGEESVAINSRTEVAAQLEQLSKQTDVNDSMIGRIPTDELPERVRVFNYNGSDQTQERGRAMVKLRAALEQNAQIVGFCNVPEAVCKLEIDTERFTNPYRPQYKIPIALHPFVSRQVDAWKAAGRIRLAPPGCVYNNPITCAPKKDDEGKVTGVRVCLDTRAVNLRVITRDMHMIPLIVDILGRMAGHSLFGEFDLSDAYLQFPLDETSQPLTAFTWEGQQWVFTGCIYGLSSIPNFFQRIMSRIFIDLPYVRPYLDNLPFASHNWDEHTDQALMIIERLNSVNLRLKPSAMKIGYSAMRCLGHLVTRNGVALDPDKQSALRDFQLPTTGAAMRTFLGFTGFLRAHVRHYADLAAPLEAVKNENRIEPTPLIEQHFHLLKRAITTAPILRQPSANKPFRIATDASNTGVGGVLYQPDEIGGPMTAENIVEICSKSLEPSRRSYPAYKKELWAIVYALRKFHPHVWGRPGLVVETDHRPLTYIFATSTLNSTLQQWLDVILDHAFTIEHRPGILNVLPDALSRLYSEAYSPTSVWGIASVPLPAISIKLHLDQHESKNDPVIPSIDKADHEAALAVQRIHEQAVKTQLNSKQAHVRANTLAKSSMVSSSDDINEIPSTSSSSSASAKSSMRPTENDEARLLIELEKRGKQSPATEEEKVQMIRKQHGMGHYGRRAIFDALYEKGIWWPHIHQYIEDELKKCDACLRYNVAKAGYHPAQSIHALGPGDHYQVDLSTHLPPSPDGYVAVVHLIDVFTGFVVLKAIRDEEATTVAQVLFDTFMLIGIPRILQSDNGPQFVSDTLRALNSLLGIQSRFISAYNPRVDGKVERSIGTVMGSIKKLLHGTDKHWPLFLNFAQYAYNTKVATLTASSPFVLFFNRMPNEIRDYSKDSDNPSSISLNEWQEHQQRCISVIYPAIDERIRTMSMAMRQHLNKSRRTLLHSLPIGSIVMLKDPHRQNKREPTYIGPYQIARRTQNGLYVLRDHDNDILDRMVPMDQLKVVSRQAGFMDNIYTVRKVIDHRGEAGAYEYLIDWKGYGPNDRTWEKASNILDADCIKSYWESVEQKQQSASSTSQQHDQSLARTRPRRR